MTAFFIWGGGGVNVVKNRGESIPRRAHTPTHMGFGVGTYLSGRDQIEFCRELTTQLLCRLVIQPFINRPENWSLRDRKKIMFK